MCRLDGVDPIPKLNHHRFLWLVYVSVRRCGPYPQIVPSAIPVILHQICITTKATEGFKWPSQFVIIVNFHHQLRRSGHFNFFPEKKVGDVPCCIFFDKGIKAAASVSISVSAKIA